MTTPTPNGSPFDAMASMQPGAFWAKITGNAAGTNRYAWTQIDDGDTAAFDTGLSEEFAATGTSAASGACAYEINGRTDVATGTRVLLRPAGDFSYYVFAAPATTSGTVTGTGTDNHIARWDGTSAIQDSYASISDAGALTVAAVTSPGSTDPRIVTGISGTTTRTTAVNLYSGTGGLTISATGSSTTNATWSLSAGLGAFSYTVSAGVSSLADGSDIHLDCSSAAAFGATLTASAVGLTILGGSTPYAYLQPNRDGGTVSSTTGGPYLRVAVEGGGGGSQCGLMVSPFSDSDYAVYAIRRLGVNAYGVTGALAPGATATGGIITDLGTGAFVGTASSNAFTNTNSFTSPGAGDVPLTVKAAAAQTADLIQALDSGGLTVLARVEADGEIEAASGAARLNSVLNDGQLALYNSAGASYATLTAGASDVLTTSGGFTVTTGGLTVSAGGANITGTVTATEFSGSGASLTTLNASNLSSGTVAAARLPIGTSVQAWGADLDALEALSGTNTIYYRSGANTWSAVTVGTGLSFSSGTLSSSVSSGTVPNLLRNGAAWVYQRGTSASGTDGTYGVDGWYHLVQTGAVAQDRGTNIAPYYSVRLTQSQASAQRMGIAQAVEYADSLPMRSRSVRFQFRASASTSTAIRFAILEWVGGADSLTRDVVNDWTSSTYTAGNFFAASNLTVTAVGSGTATTTAADFSLTGTLGSSLNNLVVFIWTENTAAQNVTLEITKAGLYDGTGERDWLPRSFAEELATCHRYLFKRSDGAIGIALNSNVMYSNGVERFPVEMRAAPTVSGSSFSVNAGSAGTPSFTTVTQGFAVSNSAANWTATAIVSLNGATFSAEL